MSHQRDDRRDATSQADKWQLELTSFAVDKIPPYAILSLAAKMMRSRSSITEDCYAYLADVCRFKATLLHKCAIVPCRHP